MSDRLQAVYMAANAHQAHLLRNLLEQAGIRAFVSNDTLNGVHFVASDWLVRAAGGPGFAPTAPLLVVHEHDMQRAQQILKEAEQAQLAGAEAPELARLTAEASDHDAWPSCPHCQRPRLATCPVCETSGTHFATAYYPESPAADANDTDANAEEPTAAGTHDIPRQVICSICDEPFAPRYPVRCEWCGHRFADGVELPPRQRAAAPLPDWDGGFNAKVVLVILLMTTLGVGVLVWLRYVAQS